MLSGESIEDWSDDHEKASIVRYLPDMRRRSGVNRIRVKKALRLSFKKIKQII